MRLVEELVELVPGVMARARRTTRQGDWYFQGHFPDEPVVPAIVFVELLAQTGGLAVAPKQRRLRVAAIGRFKFLAAVAPGSTLDVVARVAGRFGSMVKIEGEVAVDGQCIAAGSVTLAEVPF
jgi:3-hydroxymyristoyl/3-hydroxydecanoyl-(acyl carrier protein) dehydratase